MDSVISVGEIMTRNFVWTGPETNLRECAKLMIRKKVGSLIIKESEKLLGILTEKDIIWAIVKKSKSSLVEIKASDLMKRKVITIKPSSDISEAMDKFRTQKVRRLPVVENGKLIGIITLKDVLKYDPNLYNIISQNLQIKEETRKLTAKAYNLSRKVGICEICGNSGPLYHEGVQSICKDCFENR